MPDATAQDPKTETTDLGSRMALVITQNRSVLRMDLRVARVYFSREKMAKADLDTEETDVGRYVDSVKTWTEEVRKKGGNPASPRSYRRPLGKSVQQFEMRVNDPTLRRALLQHQAERIIRQLPPPYDTVRVERGRTVNYHDFSLHYGIVFPDSTRRNQFLEDVKGLSSVADASKPMTAEDFNLNIGDVPPDDLNGDLTDQWNIDDNTPAGVDMVDAWEIMEDLNNIKESKISFIEPNVYNDELSTVSHRDMDGNIDFDTNNGFYSVHAMGVSSVAGAVTNNDRNIAGATYNQPIEIRQTADETVNGVTIEEQIAFAISSTDSKIINFSWSATTKSEAIELAINTGLQNGKIFIASLGGSGVYPAQCDVGECIWPAAYPDVFAIQAHKENGEGFTGALGPIVDFSAPGRNIPVLWSNSTSYLSETVKEVQGTSFAAPHVSAIVSIMQAVASGFGADLSRSQVESILANASESLPWEALDFVCRKPHKLFSAHYLLAPTMLFLTPRRIKTER